MVLFALSCFGLLLFLWLELRRPGAAQAQGLPSSRSRSPRPRSSAVQADVRVAGRERRQGAREDARPAPPQPHGRDDRARRRVRPDRAGRPRDPAPEDAARRDLRRAHAGHRAPRAPSPTAACSPTARCKGTVQLDEIFQALDPTHARGVPGPGSRSASQGDRAAAARTSTTRSATCPPSPTTAPTCCASSTARSEQTRAAHPQHRRRVRRAHPGRAQAPRPRRHGRADVRRDLAPPARRWPRRSRSSRRSSTSRSPRSRAWRRFSKDDRPAGPGPAARRCATRSRRCATCARSRPTCDRTLREPRPADHGVEDRPARAAQTLDGSPSRCSPSCSRSSSSSTRCCSSSSTTSSTPRTSSPTARRRSPTPCRRATPNEVGHYLRQFAPDRPRDRRDVPPTARRRSRGNAYLTPARCRAQKRAQGDDLPELRLQQRGRPAA